MKALRWLGLGTLGVVGAAALGAAIYAWLASPVTDGALSLPGLKAPIRIERDAHGIPTIEAGSDEDALFGLGVVHAQDRLWQMEMHRRIGAGRLAEILGPAALDTDRFMRALGVRRTAQAQWRNASAETRALMQAYADGVNAAMKHVVRARPPEFLAFGIEPEPWDPVDSIAWTLMVAWDLGGNWTSELQRLRLSAQLDVARIDEVLPPYPGTKSPATRDYAALYRELGIHPSPERRAWLSLPDIAPESGVEGAGSNNWVVAGSHTTTGKPMLANDPHLGLNAPAIWYLVRLKSPGLDVAGATMPGTPGVALGQNARLAWGFTNTGPDVQDLYIEAVDERDATRYRTPEGTAAFEATREVIRVKGQADVDFTARRTRHGPVISDAGGSLNGLLPPRYALALRWSALEEDSDVLKALMGMMKAPSVRAFVEASQGWHAPMQNMVVADVDGAIAMVSAGRVPRRWPDNDLMGVAPAPGWDPRYDWADWVPAGETPREFDPPRGWIATANQRIHGDDYRHYLASDWALPYRQQRAEQLLRARAQHSLDSLADIQSDSRSLAVAPLLPWLLRAQPRHPLTDAAHTQLKGFDGLMDARRAAPLIYWAWKRQLARLVFADDIGAPLFDRSFGRRTFQDALEGVLARDDAAWCDDRSTPEPESCAQQSEKALGLALDELAARFGPDPASWRWGDAHQSHSEHRPFSRVAWLAPWFHLQAPVSGDTYTLNAHAVGLAEPAQRRYRSTHGPSLRALYDLGDRQQSRAMHPSGQSGLPWLRSYRNFLEPWAQGHYVPLWPAADGAAVGGTLRISPRP